MLLAVALAVTEWSLVQRTYSFVFVPLRAVVKLCVPAVPKSVVVAPENELFQLSSIL
ncbi:MAG: hypothetical protein M3Z65_10475 [Chloroflexota bacterium]|nr:hypothetical protein [Chloroflexota bacterium]